MLDTPLCEYGQIQTIKHIVEVYCLTKHEGKIERRHNDDSEAQEWLRSLEECL